MNRSIPYGTFTKMYMSAGGDGYYRQLYNKVRYRYRLAGGQVGRSQYRNNRIVVKQAGFYLLTGIVNWTCRGNSADSRTIMRLNNTINAICQKLGLAVSMTGAQDLQQLRCPGCIRHSDQITLNCNLTDGRQYDCWWRGTACWLRRGSDCVMDDLAKQSYPDRRLNDAEFRMHVYSEIDIIKERHVAMEAKIDELLSILRASKMGATFIKWCAGTVLALVSLWALIHDRMK